MTELRIARSPGLKPAFVEVNGLPTGRVWGTELPQASNLAAAEHHRLLDAIEGPAECITQKVVADLPGPARAGFGVHMSPTLRVTRFQVERRLLGHLRITQVRIRVRVAAIVHVLQQLCDR